MECHFPLLTQRSIVEDDQYERASEMLKDYFDKTSVREDEPGRRHSLYDKIRMAVEILVFGWLMPGRKSRRHSD
jgi:hypothetical protein